MKLIPTGLVASRWVVDSDDMVIDAIGIGVDAACPDCGVVTRQVHSRYWRRLQDLPAHGRRMVIRVMARRFRCPEPACPRKTFAEPFTSVVEGRHARRTARSEALVHQIALAIGGRPGERLTTRLCVGGSRDTLLRLIRRRAPVNDHGAEVSAVAAVDPDLLTSVERRQLEGAKRRDAENASMRALAETGVSLKEIRRRTGLSRGTVRRIVRGEREDVFRQRQSTLAPCERMLDTLWNEGCRNGAELHRRICAAGFKGSRRVVTEWTTRRRQEMKAATKEVPRKAPSARTIAKMLTTHRDGDSPQQIELLAMIATATPDGVTARDQLDAFHAIVRERTSEGLDPWLADADGGPLASFVTGLRADIAAVNAALREPWSSGQVEGTINKLKLLKRQMYGRANLDLLEARLMGAA